MPRQLSENDMHVARAWHFSNWLSVKNPITLALQNVPNVASSQERSQGSEGHLPMGMENLGVFAELCEEKQTSPQMKCSPPVTP